MSRPKHLVIREWIEEQIRRGEFVEGQRIPTEQELMTQFSVSRAPVQQAMRALEHAGVVIRRGGAGTFISSARIRSSLLEYLRPHRADAEEHGDHKVLNTRVTAASSVPWAATVFSSDTPIALLDRLKIHTSGRPITLERAAIDLTQAPEILEQDLVSMTTIPYYNSIGLPVHRVTTQLSAALLSETDAQALELDPSIPVIRQQRTIYSGAGSPIETALFYTHPHHLTLEVTEIGLT